MLLAQRGKCPPPHREAVLPIQAAESGSVRRYLWRTILADARTTGRQERLWTPVSSHRPVHNRGCTSFGGRSRSRRGRVDLGGCPPRSPTDPDLWDYHIRLLESRIRYGSVDRVDHSRARQRVALVKSFKRGPVKVRSLRAPPQPRLPDPLGRLIKAMKRRIVARDAIVGIVAPKFSIQGLMRSADFLVAMTTTPFVEGARGATQPTARRLSLDHPGATPGPSPVVGKAQKLKRLRTFSSFRTPRGTLAGRSCERHQACLRGVQFQPVA